MQEGGTCIQDELHAIIQRKCQSSTSREAGTFPTPDIESHGLVHILEGRVKHHSRQIKEAEERLLSIQTDSARQLANSAEKRPRYYYAHPACPTCIQGAKI